VKRQKQAIALGIVLILIFAAASIIPSSTTAAAITDAGSSLVGNWTGDSICVGNRPACHDEQVIYRIPKAPDSSGKVTITADKIVNGKPELMGVLDFKYDSEKQTLICDFTRGNIHGLWELTVKGNTMEGTLMLLPDKTLVRRAKLKKETANQPAA
jgi:hypothetical protein